MLSLRFALKLDAVVTGANGAAYLILAGPLEDLLGLSPSLLRAVGAFLLVFAAALWLLAERRTVPAAAATAVIALNGLWAAGSIAFVALGVEDPTTVGGIWIVLQAIVVAGFAELQALGRSSGQDHAVTA
jgi:hypothetical protein